MKRFALLSGIILVLLSSCYKRQAVERPKLVIGIVIDQMRWDYLYRYYDRYTNNGFRRLMKEGYNCQNTMLNYIPSFTGPGHSCIYTGSVPSIHGIAANDWIDNLTGQPVYCVDDTSVHLADGMSKWASMSPRNLLVTTITDELRLATNLHSRVYGVAIKDRSSILPAGHLANAAYWYDDKTGNFVTSTYYPNQNPDWLHAFNKRHIADSLTRHNWDMLYPVSTYTQSTTDANNYEKALKGESAPVFPHKTDSLTLPERFSLIKTLPAGNTITFEMAKACIEGEKLGRGGITDFLCLSFSSTDYAGHQFGPNSIEMEDMYLRFDKELGSFLNYLDSKIGRGNYLLFLSADHGAAHNATFLTDNDIPAGTISPLIEEQLNQSLKTIFGKDSIVYALMNYQVYLNESLITTTKLDRDKVKTEIRQWFNKRPEILYAVDLENMDATPLPEPIRTMIVNGYYRNRSGCMQIILNPGWYDKEGGGTTHGTWNPYDTHIPLLWYGWHVPKGDLYREVNMTDIAPTIASMLHIQMPNGCIGKVIPGICNLKEHK
jgi:predicted AlkP superfamily pyrophosphatase or phosphodiesterase